jgi:hypothetical protein
MTTPAMTTPTPAAQQMRDEWDAMLAGLSIDRVRRLLEDAVGTLEQVIPPTGTALDAVLRQVRRALTQLGVRA